MQEPEKNNTTNDTAQKKRAAGESNPFALRVNAKTMEIIERWAQDEFRSINGQLQWIIEDSIRRYGKKE